MRRLIFAAALVAALLTPTFAAPSEALACETYVNGYYRSNGTYVSGYYRTCANSTTDDNWTTRGNTNPYTGEPGTRSTDYTYTPSYSPSYSPSYPSPSRCNYTWGC